MMMVKILLTLVLIATITITPAFAESIPIKITKMNTLLHHNIPYTGDGVEIQNVTADLDFISLIFGVTVESPGKISITLDRSIFDAVIDGEDDEFFVLADGEEIQFDEEKTDMSRTLSFSVPEGTEEIEVIGTKLFGESFLEKLEESAQKAEEELAANKEAAEKALGQAMADLIEREAQKTQEEYEARMAAKAAEEEAKLAALAEACTEGTIFVDGECVVEPEESIDSGPLINSIFAAMGIGLAVMIIVWGIFRSRHKKSSVIESSDS